MMDTAGQQPERDDAREQTLAWQVSLALANGIQLLMVGLLFDYVLLSGIELSGIVRLLAIAVILAGVVRSYGWLVLVAVQIKLFFLEPGSPGLGLSIGSSLYCVSTLLLIAYALAADRVAPKLSRLMATQILELVGTDGGGLPPKTSVFSWRQFGVHALYCLVTIAGVVFVSMLLIEFLPLTRQSSRLWFQQSLENSSFLWPGPSIVVVLLLLFVVVRELAWRQMNGQQASLWLRSSFMIDHRRDLLMIVRRRFRIRKKAITARRRS